MPALCDSFTDCQQYVKELYDKSLIDGAAKSTISLVSSTKKKGNTGSVGPPNENKKNRSNPRLNKGIKQEEYRKLTDIEKLAHKRHKDAKAAKAQGGLNHTVTVSAVATTPSTILSNTTAFGVARPPAIVTLPTVDVSTPKPPPSDAKPASTPFVWANLEKRLRTQEFVTHKGEVATYEKQLARHELGLKLLEKNPDANLIGRPPEPRTLAEILNELRTEHRLDTPETISTMTATNKNIKIHPLFPSVNHSRTVQTRKFVTVTSAVPPRQTIEIYWWILGFWPGRQNPLTSQKGRT
jgi:hypothetical protein